jgi:hypothetical protein
MSDPYVIYMENGDKHIRKDRYVHMVYKNAGNILKTLKFKHKTVNDYNQHLCGGWSFYPHKDFEEVDRVVEGLKPVGISMTYDLSQAEAKRKELSGKGLLVTIYKREASDEKSKDLYFITASPRGNLGKFFRNLDILGNDYRRNNLEYCANIIEHYKHVNFIKFHNMQYDDHHTCITGLVLGYPIENSIALITRDDDDDEYFDFEEFNKDVIEEDHLDDDECDCDECCERRYNEDNEEEECTCMDCHIYRHNLHISETDDHENCETCDFYKKYFNDLKWSDEHLQEIDDKTSLRVVPYDEELGLFRDLNNFIVFQIEPGKIGVIGKLDNEQNKIISLTEEDAVKAKDIGLITDDDMREEMYRHTDIWELD